MGGFTRLYCIIYESNLLMAMITTTPLRGTCETADRDERNVPCLLFSATFSKPMGPWPAITSAVRQSG